MLACQLQVIREAREIIRNTINANRSTRRFCMVLAPICFVTGVAIAFLCAYVQIWLAVVELVIAPGLWYSIKGLVAADKNNTIILQESHKVLRAANSQIVLRRRLQ